ncbi:MAG: NAD-dependent epimerase/dehydratase family protein, partial [Pirellulales bacterium]
MKALITGITGFVGGWLAEHLLECGDQVLGCSQSGRWLPTSAAGPMQQVPLVRFSLSDDEGLPDAEYQHIAAFAPDCIYHLAGVAHAHRCGPAGKVSASAWEVNVQGTQRVSDLARRLPAAPRVLFVSSSSVYPAGTVN